MATDTQHATRNTRLAKWLARLLLLAGLLLLIIWGVRLARTGLSLREHLRQMQALAGASESADPAVACSLVRDLRADVTALRGEAGWLASLSPALGWLPRFGGDLRAAPHLLSVADGLTEASVLACDALEPMLISSDSSLEEAAQLLADHRANLEQALTAVERAQVAWARVDTAGLSPWLASKTALLERGLPLLRAGLGLATVAPDLLGMNGPRAYLILAQNEDELRPTGGFLSSVACLTLDRGRITELVFLDANLVDDYAHKPYPEPPEPLFKYMGSELWLFRDANWSPDFPTSAQQIMDLYEYGQGVSVDGVIALDQYAVEWLIRGFGEVHISGMSEPIRADNVRDFMHMAWNPPDTGVSEEWIFSRKDFMKDLGLALLQQMEEGPKSINWLKVVDGVYHALAERHLLLFIDNAPDIAGILARTGWDGALHQTPGDYIMVVDTNIGFGKVNPLVRREMHYEVSLYADGGGRASLTVTYLHQGRREHVRCQHRLEYTGHLTYEEMMHRCYYNYLRVYVPAGSVLRWATSHPTPGEYLLRGEPDSGQAVTLGSESGKTVFAQFFVVEYGRTLTTRFEYDLPRVVQPKNGQDYYSLWVQKQPGTNDIPFFLRIALPPHTWLVAAQPAPQSLSEGVVEFELNQNTDVFIEVFYDE